MTTYQIEAFITLAQTLNYTKASSLLHTTQPNLSKMIVNMEQELGVKLFVRNKRDVSLSPAGVAFLPQAERMMEIYQKAIDDARDAEMGIQGTIKVGFLGSAMQTRLPSIVRAFREKHPKIYLELIDYTFSPLMAALIENKIDVAMLPDKELEFIPKLEKKFIYSDDMCAVVPQNHRLANRDFINIQELKHEPFIMMDPKISDRDYNLVNSICMDGGFIPNAVHLGNTLTNLLLMVACGFGVSILAKHMTHLGMNDVCFVPLKGYEGYFKMVCAWRRDANPSIPKLIEVIG